MVKLRDYTRRKLNLLDRAIIDLRLTDQDYRVLAYIAAAVDQKTELARRKQSVIAVALGRSVRGIQVSLSRLAECGYIKFETKEGGTYVNAYRLMLEEANTGSPSDNEKANRNSPFSKKRRMEAQKKANACGQKGEPPFVHDPFISLEIPPVREPAIIKALGSLGRDLAARIGPDYAASWFGKAVVVDVVGDTLTLQFPTKFITDRARSDYESAVLKCCSALVPSIRVVRFTTAAQSAA